MALINYKDGGRIYFYPFCSNKFIEIASQCVGCQFAHKVGLADVQNGTLVLLAHPHFPKLCNPHVDEYPLPLYKCSVCNRSFLGAVLSYIIIISLLTLFANSWSIFVWLRKQKRPQIIFKLSLAVSDLLFGAIVLPSVAACLIETMYIPHEEYFDFSTYLDTRGNVEDYEHNWVALFSPFRNKFIALVLYISQGASLSSVLLLNIDRHIAITYNIKYYQIMSKRKSVILLISMWLVIGAMGLATTFACGTFLARPFALFLPIIEPNSDTAETEELLKVLVIYLLPLGGVFFTSCIIALCTSVKLYKLSHSGDNYIARRSSEFSQRKSPSRPFQTCPFHLPCKKSNAINQTEEISQDACDCSGTCTLKNDHAEASSELMEIDNSENATTEISVPQGREVGPLSPTMFDQKKMKEKDFDLKTNQELVSPTFLFIIKISHKLHNFCDYKILSYIISVIILKL